MPESNPLIRMVADASETIAPTETPTRQQIREYVAYQMTKAKEVQAAGGNPQHVALDAGDRLERFGACLPVDDQPAFVQIFTEEFRAAGTQAEAEAQTEAAKQIGAAWTANQIGATVVSVLLFFILTTMFKACD